MINRKNLLNDTRRIMALLERDIISRSHGPGEMPEVVAALQTEFEKASAAKRTAQNFEDWRTDFATQQAAAWILSAVFVRFLEDNELIAPPLIAGPGDRLQHARDQHELYFRAQPTETDREYLLHVFHEVGKLPGGREIFGKHNSVFELPQGLSGDAAGELLRFFQRIDPDSGALVHDFTDPEWDTRFLGDLYQDLSEAARKKFALLQTPEFIEEFILDRTLEPALDEFGLQAPPVVNDDGEEIAGAGFRMIDPAPGSGHFLLGAFRRILDRWQRSEPGANVRDLVQRTLDSIHGVDINPYAVAIARFRLLIAALKACRITRLKDAPAFHFHLAAGDSLLHGIETQGVLDFDELAHHYHAEDIEALRRILRPGIYHTVVANPPYITVKDAVLNQAYRDRYTTCHRQYSLSVPFMERIFRLAVPGGYTGQITANSFMKREFGKKLIEEFFPTVDLTHVVDTSGAYIPGHGTPTVILFGCNRTPVASTLRTVLGIRGEPETPDDPALGFVWSAICSQIDQPGSQSEFVSAGDSSRELFYSHPWSIGGGGAAELKEELEGKSQFTLSALISEVGRSTHTGEDDFFFMPYQTVRTQGYLNECIPLIIGEDVRDYQIMPDLYTVFPYDRNLAAPLSKFSRQLQRHYWRFRRNLKSRKDFGQYIEERGLKWTEHSMFFPKRFCAPLSIVFAEVATYNHFVLDRGGKVFKQTAPVIKLPEGATEKEHLGLLGILNSSTACFWMKQVCFPKKGFSDDKWEERMAFNAGNIERLPLPTEKPLSLPQTLDDLAQRVQIWAPSEVVSRWAASPAAGLRDRLHKAEATVGAIRRQMIFLQEELDWQCYRLYGLLDEALTWPESAAPLELDLGQRAFEIVLARQLAAGDSTSSSWFTRHGSTPITEIPDDWPEDYRTLVARRIAVIESNKNIALIERPEYKRRWNTEPWAAQLERALREALLLRLERFFDFDGRMRVEDSSTITNHEHEHAHERGCSSTRTKKSEYEDDKEIRDCPQRSEVRAEAGLSQEFPIALVSLAKLADCARQDRVFMAIAEIYRNDPAFDVLALVTDLVDKESVPYLPVLRYKDTGLRKRMAWEMTWELQRREDAIDGRATLPPEDPNHLSPNEAERLKKQEVGTIPVPPKYDSKDFLHSHYWKLRGKLDVPKERWVTFPHCEGQDGSLMIAWAGYDHLQLARAISAHYVDIQERLGGRDDPRLVPLLACLIELLPWLKQWHNAVDPEYNMAMGDYFEGFILEEARGLGMTLDAVRAWQPAEKAKGGRKKKG